MRRSLLLFALVPLACSKPPPPPPPASEAAPLGADITFITTPPGASVELDDLPLDGVTPFTKHLEAGKGNRKVRFLLPGYEPATDTFLVPLAPYTESATLKLAAKVQATSTPAGASVLVDGKVLLAKTPGEVPLVAGDHEVLIQLAGYVPVKLKLKAGPRSPIAVKLFPAATVSVASTPSGARIFVDGVDTGRVTPDASVPVAANKAHVVVARMDKLRSPQKALKVLRPGQTAKLDLQLADLGRKDLESRRAEVKRQMTRLEAQQRAFEKKTAGFVVTNAHQQVADEQRLTEIGDEIQQLADELADLNDQLEAP